MGDGRTAYALRVALATAAPTPGVALVLLESSTAAFLVDPQRLIRYHQPESPGDAGLSRAHRDLVRIHPQLGWLAPAVSPEYEPDLLSLLLQEPLTRQRLCLAAYALSPVLLIPLALEHERAFPDTFSCWEDDIWEGILTYLTRRASAELVEQTWALSPHALAVELLKKVCVQY